MRTLLRALRDDLLLPLLQRPALIQVAALCLRDGPAGREVLLVTSRGTGRWLLPKGWPGRGLDGAGSALREAREEAGVARATVRPEPIGRYAAVKVGAGGLAEPCEVLVYEVRVDTLADDWPERGQRCRRWAAPQVAAGLVEEAGLKALLAAL